MWQRYQCETFSITLHPSTLFGLELLPFCRLPFYNLDGSCQTRILLCYWTPLRTSEPVLEQLYEKSKPNKCINTTWATTDNISTLRSILNTCEFNAREFFCFFSPNSFTTISGQQHAKEPGTAAKPCLLPSCAV